MMLIVVAAPIFFSLPFSLFLLAFLRMSRILALNLRLSIRSLRDELHVPLGSAGGETSHRNVNGKWDRRKLRKNTGRRRLDQHNQGHKQSKREIREDKVIDGAYYIQSTNIVSQLHDDLQHQQQQQQQHPRQQQRQRHTDDNDGLNYVLSSSSSSSPPNKSDRKTMKTKNSFTNQADIDSNGNVDTAMQHGDGNIDDSNSNGNNNKNGDDDYDDGIGNSKTMRVTFKLKNGKIVHKIALQRTRTGDNSRRNIASKLNRNDNDSAESVYADDDHDKMVVTGRMKSTANETTTAARATATSNALTDNDNIFNADTKAQNVEDIETVATINHDNESLNDTKNQLHRIKRKSGKAAGALGRPKGGSDSGSKSTSRKKESK